MPVQITVDGRSLQDSHLTGVGMYTSNLLTSWEQLHKPVEVLTIGNQKKVITSASNQRHIFLPGKIFNIGAKYNVNLISKPHADIYFLPHITFWPRKQVPYVVTVHDIAFWERPYYYRGQYRLWHQWLPARELLHQAAGIICVSSATKQLLLKKWPELSTKSLEVISESSSQQTTNLTVPPEILPQKFILYLGTIEPRKNVDSLLKAFSLVIKQNPDLLLVIAGKVGWANRKTIDQLQSSRGVVWLSYVDEPLKNWLYQHCLLFVWPSWYEGFGLPPVEAINNQATVISSWTTSMPEQLQNQARYFNPYNYQEIAAVIIDQLASRKIATPVISRPSWQEIAEQTWNFITYCYEHRN